ncbi:unnamed protein product [Polarella glacialis]|uniref:Bestrophin homolog n=1 Tax=Polarella glacialis TaxID=89957 RepID=A0A813KX49_POLGL|nr:unnamed protein product [Polarella glacialis]
MIAYQPGTWGISFVFQIKGSVFPKAACWAAVSAAIAVLVKLLVFSWHDTEYMNGIEAIWSSYSFVLGFVMVFRNSTAYSRFWEGTSLTKQMTGQWYVAFSNVFAFCSRDESKKADVVHFQSVLVRLASLLHCSALHQICDLEDNILEIINSDEMDPTSMEFLRGCANPQEVVTNWIQRLIVQAHEAGIINISPPLLSRVFQEIGGGLISLNNASKIKDFQFPFPYAQMISCMLFVHWLFTPIMAAHQIGSSAWAGAMSFFVAMSFWSLFYIALEIDQPFGEDANDLPIHKMQQEWNNSLLTLLLPCSQVVPTFEIRSIGESIQPQKETKEQPHSPVFRQHSHVRRKSRKEPFRQPATPFNIFDVDGTTSMTIPQLKVTFKGDCEEDSGGLPVSAMTTMSTEEDSEGVPVITATTMEMQEDRGVQCIVDEHTASLSLVQMANHAWRLPTDSEIPTTPASAVRSTNDSIISNDGGIADGTQLALSCLGVAGHSAVAFEGGRGSVPPHLDCFPDGVRGWSGSTARGKNKPAASHGYSGGLNFTPLVVEI